MGDELQRISTREGDTLCYKGTYLYSRYYPRKQCDDAIEKISPLPNTLYLFFSPLLGYGWRTLLEKIEGTGSYLLGIEFDQTLMYQTLLSNQEGELDHPNAKIYRLEEGDPFETVLSSLNIERFEQVKAVGINGGFQLFKERYLLLEKRATTLLRGERQNRQTIHYHADRWFSNTVQNRHLLTKEMVFHPADHPLFLVGAGTSLERDLPFLREHQKRLIIITVDTALPTLLASGIAPDFIVNLESQFYNLYDFYRSLEKEAFVFCDLTTYPRSLRIDKVEIGSFATLFHPNALHREWTESGLFEGISLPSFGSVAIMALEIATRLTRGSLFLTGIDFYTAPGKTHARHTIFHDLSLWWQGYFHRYPLLEFGDSLALNQEPLRTTNKMLLYKEQLQKGLEKISQPFFQLSQTQSLLGIPQKRESELAEELSQLSEKPPFQEIVQVNDSQQRRETLFQWEERERVRLKRILSWTEATAQRSENVQLLLESDYLYLDYPEPEKPFINEEGEILRLLQEEKNFLSRIQTRASQYLKFL